MAEVKANWENTSLEKYLEENRYSVVFLLPDTIGEVNTKRFGLFCKLPYIYGVPGYFIKGLRETYMEESPIGHKDGWFVCLVGSLLCVIVEDLFYPGSGRAPVVIYKLCVLKEMKKI